MSRRRRHSEEFKQNAVRRMLTSGATASELARELGIHPTQLFRWKQQMRHTAPAMPKQEVDEKAARRPQDWSPEEKLEAVMKSQGLTETELGALIQVLEACARELEVGLLEVALHAGVLAGHPGMFSWTSVVPPIRAITIPIYVSPATAETVTLRKRPIVIAGIGPS